jgi:hypothetical protein
MADDMRLPVFNIMYRSGMNSTNNEVLLQRDKEERIILHTIKDGRRTGLVTSGVVTAF